MDLRPYGIKLLLKPSTKLDSIKLNAIRPGTIHTNYYGDILDITLHSGQYSVVKKLGEGTYGATYSVLDNDSNEYAVKMIKLHDTRITGILKECIMQIILLEESKDAPNGPYVPVFYELAYSAKDKTMMLRSELLDGTLDQLLRSSSTEENDRLVPFAIAKVAKILKFFEERLAFNHRDLKGDNIMYKKLSNEKIRLKLIDFGLSCMTWNGLEIRGEGYSGLKSCFKKDRDLSQLMYGLARYETEYISDKLYARIAQMLQVNIDPDHTCEALDDCVLNGLRNWQSSYNFFNRANVHVPHAEPYKAIAEMQGFVKGEPFHSDAEPTNPCPKGMVLNNDRNKCEKQCGSGKMRNPQTRRCRKIPLPISASKPKYCPPGKILNPKTKRCIKDRSKPVI